MIIKLLINILSAFFTIGGLGILFGIGLAFASKILDVKMDPKVTRLEKALPGLNCGSCGYAGCVSYAEAIAGAGEVLTLCLPGGEAGRNRRGRANVSRALQFSGVRITPDEDVVPPRSVLVPESFGAPKGGGAVHLR